MIVIFECMKCKKIHKKNFNTSGLFFDICDCGSVYAKIINLKECFKFLNKINSKYWKYS